MVVCVVNLQFGHAIRSSIVGFVLGLIENELRLVQAVMDVRDGAYSARNR